MSTWNLVSLSGDVQGSIPFLALPIFTILAFASPPFPGRGVVFSGLLILINYACIVSPWPPDKGSSRPMRYGMTGSWIFLLPAVERLLFHRPEMDFWRIDEEKKPKHGRPLELSIPKLRWALALVTSPRGVGWNIGSRQVNTAREAVRRKRPPRSSFVASKLLRSLVAYPALDAVVILAKTTPIPQRWAKDTHAPLRIAFLECLMAVSVYVTMTLQFELAAAASVGIGLCNPEDWPPLFGNIAACYTVANVWGKFWHGYIRQPVLGLSHAIINFCGIPKHSSVAYFIHLLTAFSLSAFFHTLSLSVVCEGHLRTRDLILDMSRFFMAQPIATIVESMVVARYERSTQEGQAAFLCSKLDRLLASIIVRRTLGYVWVLSWFLFTGLWFVRDYIAIGVLEWPLPISIWAQLGFGEMFPVTA